MKKGIIIWVWVLVTFTSSLVLGNDQTKSPRFINPFLTPEEEMKELGIKPPKEKKVEIQSLKKLKLTGIIYGEEKVAIINSGFYKEGDEIEGFKIKEIKPLSVILIWDSQEAELKLVHVLAVTEKEKEQKEKIQGDKSEELLEEVEEIQKIRNVFRKNQ